MLFIVLPIIKTKLKILRTPFSRNSIIKTRYEISEAFYGCVLLVSFFAQNYDQVCSLKQNNLHQKKCKQAEKYKYAWRSKRRKIIIEKKRKTKNEKNRKIQTTAVKNLYFYFFFSIKNIVFCLETKFGKTKFISLLLLHYSFFVLQNIWNAVMIHQ